MELALKASLLDIPLTREEMAAWYDMGLSTLAKWESEGFLRSIRKEGVIRYIPRDFVEDLKKYYYEPIGSPKQQAKAKKELSRSRSGVHSERPKPHSRDARPVAKADRREAV